MTRQGRDPRRRHLDRHRKIALKILREIFDEEVKEEEMVEEKGEEEKGDEENNEENEE